MFITNILASVLMIASISSTAVPKNIPNDIQNLPSRAEIKDTEIIPRVPFYSQFADISSSYWQKRGCGIASLAMLIDFYTGEHQSVNTLLNQGRESGAYIQNAGWSHQGLVNLSKRYGLTGKTYDFTDLNKKQALAALKKILKKGPVIASVHYKFEPTNPIPHLAVINGIKNNQAYYNDPADTDPEGTISVDVLMEAWKKRIIVIRE